MKRALGAAFLVVAYTSCTQDFDRFEGPTTAGGDASATPPRDGTSPDGGGQVNPCAGKTSCFSTAASCNDGCRGAAEQCRQNCGTGGAGAACRKDCESKRGECERGCQATCSACAGAACESQCP